jgi:hypothetical protein
VSAGTCSFTNGVFWSLATENAKICHGIIKLDNIKVKKFEKL